MSTARLLSLSARNSRHRVGLSWRSLSAAVGEPVQARNWAVLFLGALKEKAAIDPEKPFQVFSGGREAASDPIEGIVLLDGNWKQSKTLWWRNPWLLRLKRIILNPVAPSLYGAVRRQPRRGCLSTLEAASESLLALGEPPEIDTALTDLFKKHLDQVSLGP